MQKVMYDLKLLFLKKKYQKLQEIESHMDCNCSTKDWFSIRNKIRAIHKEICEIENAQ